MSDEILYCPRGKKDDQPIPVDMGHWAALEVRLDEVATVTPAKAQELLATFNRTAFDLDRLANELELEQQISVREAKRIQATLLLDKVAGIIKEKGLPSSKDIRDAIVESDPEFLEAQERSDLIKAVTKMIKGKYDAFERAYRSVKTLVGEQNFNFALNNKNLGGDTGTSSPGAVSGFGKPKY